MEYNRSKSSSVEVIDTLNNVISLYTSIRQAGEAIGCVHGTLILADKAFKEKGVSRLIKKKISS